MKRIGYSGDSSSIDMSSDVCEAGSHHKLNVKTEEIQKEIQKMVPLLPEKYQLLEDRAVRIMMKHNSNLTEQTAANLFRMFLNLGGVYEKGNALPIK